MPVQINGTTGVTTSKVTFNDLTSFETNNAIPRPSQAGLNQVLTYNGANWVAAPISVGGDLTGSIPNPLVTKIQGVPVSNAAPTTGQTLTYNGTAWAASTLSTGTTIDSNSITSSLTAYTLKLADANKVMLCNNASSLTITIPANVFNVGTEIILIQRGGVVTLSPSTSVIIESNGSKYKTNGTSAGAVLINIANNTWFLGGNTAK